MKNIKQIFAVLLAAALLAGLLPAELLTASAADPAGAGLVTASPRSTVLLDASGLKKADTVVLGYAENSGKYYPLEWQLADAKEDSTGKTGGRLLISRHLLPAAVTDPTTGGINTDASYGSIPMSDGSTTSIHMPDAAAVLPAFKADSDYIANLGANLLQYSSWYPADVDAGLFVCGDNAASERRALENASFFELSAQEAESYVANTAVELTAANASSILRRPYAAGYAVSDAGARSWALRGKTLLGEAIAVSRGSGNGHYNKYAEGLVREAGDGPILSRPAFNLRTNAVSFFYKTNIALKSSSDGFTVIPTETEVQNETGSPFGGSLNLVDATDDKSSKMTWRAALETLPLTSATTIYHEADHSVELVFENNAIGYKIGVLTADSTGKILSYGTVRDNPNGGHIIFTPAKDVSKMYFFTYQYNSDTKQLYTSNLIEVTAERSTAMKLGTGSLLAGDKVYFNGNEAIVLNADTGIPGMTNTGSTGSLTKTGTGIDDYPVFNQDAMLMMIDTGETVKYGTIAGDLGSALDELSSIYGTEGFAEKYNELWLSLRQQAKDDTDAAKTVTEAIRTQQADFFKNAFSENYSTTSPLSAAIAYTWLSDSKYSLPGIFREARFPYTPTISVQEEEHSVYGKQLFFLSAKEFLALSDPARLAAGNTLLRSKVGEEYGIPNTDLSLTFEPRAAVAANMEVATVTSFAYEKDIEEKAAFHLRKDHMVYAVQSSAIDRSLTSSENLHTVGSYVSSCNTYEIAILDDTVHPEFYMGRLSMSEPVTYAVSNLPERSNAYIALLVTDAAGNVKQYGRISGEEFILDDSDYDYGDRVYGIYEYEIADTDHPTVYASEPQLIYTKMLDGELRIVPESYGSGETLFLDTSDVKCAGGSTNLCYGWYGENYLSEKSESGLTCPTEISDFVLNAYVFHSDDPFAQLFAHAEQTADFPVRPGETDPDYFKGGTLYYGADSAADTADYAWTVAGNPARGIKSVKETTGDPLFADPTLNNAVELLRRNATLQAGTDTVLRGYMNDGVLLTDIEDGPISIYNLSADEYSAEDQTVFRMSYADYVTLGEYPVARFAAAENSSWGREYLLRNHRGDSYFAVDPLLDIQSAESGTDAATREGINLNNKTVLFYSPAECDLSFETLRRCRQTPQGEWKATVYDLDAFDDMTVQSIFTNYNSLSISAEFDTAMEGRQITAWGMKDGRIIWMDSSEPCEEAGIASAYFIWETDVAFDELYFVARKDNGLYRSDICSAVYAASPTEIQVQFYLDGEYAEYYDHYELKDSQGNEKTKFEGDEQAYFSTFSVDTIDIRKVEVHFSDGTKITNDLNEHTQSYEMNFTVKGVRPVVKVYLETRPVSIIVETVVEPLYDSNYDFEPVTVTAPTSCLPGKSYDFTIDLQPGFYISEITCRDLDGEEPLPNTNPVTVIGKDKDGQVRELTGYAPGTYTKRVGDYGDIITIYVKELPFSLQLVSDPLGAGVVSAKLPNDRNFSTLADGDEVTVFADPFADYAFIGFTIKTQCGEETELPAKDNSATFTMPNDNVIVTAHFAKLNTVTVKMFMDGEPTDTGASWTLKDKDGTERSIYADGEQAYISATADNGLVISHIRANYSDGTYIEKATLSKSQVFDFTVRNTDPVVGIYLTTAQIPVAIEAKTVDSKGSVLDEQGGAVYAPSLVKHGNSFNYYASPFEGYYISAITCKGEPVLNLEPEEYTSAGETVIGYGAEEYRTTADTDSVYILVEFTKLAEVHSITSEFYDISSGTPVAVTDASVVYTVGGEQTDLFCAGDKVTATVSCAENYAIDSTAAEPATDLTQTEKYTFTFTMPDSDLAVTYNLKKLAVRSAYLHVNQDINLIYTVQVPEGFTDPSATFTFMGNTYTTSDYTVGADGRYNFEFENVTPQYMGEPVDVTVSANYGDYSFSHTNTGYSVRKYCVNMLGKTEDTLLRTLLADILVYGEKAQLYTDYKPNELVTKDVDLVDASTYPGLSGLYEKFVGTKDADVFWNAALLRLSNNVSLVLKFHASDTKGLSVTVKSGNRTETFTEFTPVEGQEDFYSVSFRGIYATEFDYPVSASFYRDGAQIGNTLKYSVNIYICNKQNDSNTVFAELVKALYNYGASSLKYYQERMINK